MVFGCTKYPAIRSLAVINHLSNILIHLLSRVRIFVCCSLVHPFVLRGENVNDENYMKTCHANMCQTCHDFRHLKLPSFFGTSGGIIFAGDHEARRKQNLLCSCFDPYEHHMDLCNGSYSSGRLAWRKL